MKASFKEIRAGDVAAVVARIDADPDLVRAVAKTPPKKDDGQSALQVAIKSANFEVAESSWTRVRTSTSSTLRK